MSTPVYVRNPTGPVFIPDAVRLHIATSPITVAPLTATIHRIELFAGMSIDSAVVSFEHAKADNPTYRMGDACHITTGSGEVLIRGVVGFAPIAIGTDDDHLQLTIFSDKWTMAAKRIGQIGIGTQPTTPTADVGTRGFKDQGFDISFNPDGRPNKAPSSLEFSLGSNAVYWTLKDILGFVFQYYIPTTVCTLNAVTELTSAAWLRCPTHFNLTGQTALEAIENVVKLTGETWALDYYPAPGTAVSAFRAVRLGAGAVRNSQLFKPWQRAAASWADENNPTEAQVQGSIEECRDIVQVVSGQIIKEHTYSNKESAPAAGDALLTAVSGFKDPEYKVRFAVDVSKYTLNNLGGNLTAGAKPKKLCSELCTRINAAGAAYITAAEIAADPTLQFAQRLEPQLWLSLDGTSANAKHIRGGFRLDKENGTLDLKPTLEISDPATTDKSSTLDVTNWSTVAIALTVATVLEYHDYKANTGDSYLPDPRYDLVHKTDLVPERRQLSWLPALTGVPNAVVSVAASAEEKYVDFDSRLEAIADAIGASSPAIETPLTLRLELFPIWHIGDQVKIVGRNLGQTGNEIITRISFSVHHDYVTEVEATNIVASIDPEKFARRMT